MGQRDSPRWPVFFQLSRPLPWPCPLRLPLRLFVLLLSTPLKKHVILSEVTRILQVTQSKDLWLLLSVLLLVIRRNVRLPLLVSAYLERSRMKTLPLCGYTVREAALEPSFSPRNASSIHAIRRAQLGYRLGQIIPHRAFR
jgi:hypothetical protein